MSTPDFNVSIEWNTKLGDEFCDALVTICGGGLAMTKAWKHHRTYNVHTTFDEYYTTIIRCDGSQGYGVARFKRVESKSAALHRGVFDAIQNLLEELAGDVAAYEAIRDSHVVTERNDLFLVDL
jgi:hypothetical protein